MCSTAACHHLDVHRVDEKDQQRRDDCRGIK